MKVERIGPVKWMIPQDAKPGMRVPGIVYASEELMAAIQRDASLEQVANAATLPGIVKASLAMPDIHQGYGLPVGGVVATDVAEGVISPGGVGYDINCGVRLLRTKLTVEDVQPRLGQLIDALYADRDHVGVEAQVTYEDGRTATIRADVRIRGVEAFAGDDKERIDQALDAQPRLRHQPPQRVGAPQPPQPCLGKPHPPPLPSQLSKLVRVVEAVDRQVPGRGTEVLPERQDVDVHRPQISHRLENLVCGLSEPQDHP